MGMFTSQFFFWLLRVDDAEILVEIEKVMLELGVTKSWLDPAVCRPSQPHKINHRNLSCDR